MTPVGVGVLNPVLEAVFGTAPTVQVVREVGVLPKWQDAQSGTEVVGIWVVKALKTTIFVIPT
jgi:hypothetical protein